MPIRCGWRKRRATKRLIAFCERQTDEMLGARLACCHGPTARPPPSTVEAVPGPSPATTRSIIAARAHAMLSGTSIKAAAARRVSFWRAEDHLRRDELRELGLTGT